MPTANITTSVRRVNGASVIDIVGEVNAAADDALSAAFNQASQDGVKVIVMNFTGLEYMNSSGIGVLVTLLIRAQRNKQKLRAYGLSDHYKQIFALTRLNEAIGIYDTEAEAVSAP
ncbi:MAG: STAS domain-containing protein [Caldilineales bacterium]